MPRTDEAEWWFNAVYEAIQQIPHGKVTSYGQIAALLGQPQRSRQVGVCLKHLPTNTAETTHFYNNENVPWQRVINARGMISHRGPGAAARQAAALQAEGVTVHTDSLGEFYVDLATFGWFPRSLPGESDEESDAQSAEP